MATVLFGAGLVIALALLIAINHKLAHLAPRLWAMMREEHARADGRAMTVLQEAAAMRVGLITTSLRQYEKQVAEAFRAHVAESQNRARIVERRSDDAGVALAAASELVRDLRALLDGLGVVHGRSAVRADAERDEERKTLKMGAPPNEISDEPEDEPTRIGTPPLAGTAPNGLRLAPQPHGAGRGETR